MNKIQSFFATVREMPSAILSRSLISMILMAPLSVSAQPSSDISLSGSVSQAVVEPGSTVTFSYEVINLGPSPADNRALISDPLPSQLTLVSCETTGSSACGFSQNGGLRVNLENPIPVHGVETANFVLELDESATPGSQIDLEAGVAIAGASGTPDPDISNNSVTLTISVPQAAPQADLSLTKTASADTVALGDQFDYTMTIENEGPDESETVELLDTLPPELTYVSCSTDGAPGSSCELLADGETFRAAFDSIGSGISRNVTLTVMLNETAPVGIGIINLAEVSSLDSEDPDQKDNSDNALITTVAAPEPLTFYLHGFDVPGTADGFTMDMNPPSPPQTLGLNLINGPKWYSELELTGSFAAGDFTLTFPCSLGIGVATTYSLHRTAQDGSNPELLASLTQPLQICTGLKTIAIPVAVAEAFDEERLRLRISTLLGLSISLDLGEDVKLVTPVFTEPMVWE